MGFARFVSVEFAAQPAMTPQQRLWFSVLMQAARDAMGNLEVKNDQLRQERMEARGWFDWGGRDFAMVCALAGLDPDAVQEAWRVGKFKAAEKRGRSEQVNSEEKTRQG